MLNISFLHCTKVELKDLTVCIVVNGEPFQAYSDLDLDLTKLNIEFVRAIFICYNVFLDIFLLSYAKTHTQKHIHVHVCNCKKVCEYFFSFKYFFILKETNQAL